MRKLSTNAAPQNIHKRAIDLECELLFVTGIAMGLICRASMPADEREVLLAAVERARDLAQNRDPQAD